MASQELVPELLAGAFERDGENLAIHLRQDFLDAQLVDQQQVFEDEHQVPDGLDQIRVCLLDVLQDLLAGVESSRLNISATARTPP